MTLIDYTEKIQSVYVSREYNLLKAKHAKITFLEAIRKSRSETTFSALLAWVINNPEFSLAPSSPLRYLLILVAKNAVIESLKSGLELIDGELTNAIITNNFEVTLNKAEVELQAKGKERIDIAIDFKISYSHFKNKTVRLFIENKIDSIEGKNQCKRYFEYFSSDKYVDFNIFVFLSISHPQTLSSSNFIKVSHQEILDNVLMPIYIHKEKYSQSASYYLEEYIHSLTSLNTKGKPQIAMDEKIQKLLREFYLSNQDIIDQAVLAGCDDPDVKKAVETKQLTRTRRTFSISHPDLIDEPIYTNQNTLLETVVRIICKKNTGITDIDHLKAYFPSIKARTFYTLDSKRTGYGDYVHIGNSKVRISTQILRTDKDSKIIDDFIGDARALGFEIVPM